MRCAWEGRLVVLAFAPFAGERLMRAIFPGRAACQRGRRAESGFSAPFAGRVNALRTRVFQQLARRNQAANAHGNAGDNGRGAKNDAPCSCAFHCSLLLDVHCGLLGWMYLSCALPVMLRFSLCFVRCSGFFLRFRPARRSVGFALRLRFPFRPIRVPSLFLLRFFSLRPRLRVYAPASDVRNGVFHAIGNLVEVLDVLGKVLSKAQLIGLHARGRLRTRQGAQPAHAGSALGCARVVLACQRGVKQRGITMQVIGLR